MSYLIVNVTHLKCCKMWKVKSEGFKDCRVEVTDPNNLIVRRHFNSFTTCKMSKDTM